MRVQRVQTGVRMEKRLLKAVYETDDGSEASHKTVENDGGET